MLHRNYLSSHRLHWALTKAELAQLIGYRSRDVVSRCEAAQRHPTFRFVLACEIIFGESPRRLFPDAYDAIEESVMARASLLDQQIRHRSDAGSARKRQLLNLMMDRALNAPIV